jgi:hypothetical protein
VGRDYFYKPGSFYRICDRTGFRVRAERTKKEWDQLIVRDQSWEIRQPQDFVRGVRDDQTVPEARPRPNFTFIGVQTTLSGDAAQGAFSDGFSDGFSGAGLPVASIAGFSVGDNIAVLLDDGSVFETAVSSIDASGMIIYIATDLPSSASSGNIVTDLTTLGAVSSGDYPASG